MSDITVENDEPPIGQATIVYLGPAAPHWEIRPVFGERDVMDSFRDRVNARLLLLPPHDPQFRRNRERVNHIQIEVVGGLIHQQQIRLTAHDPCQREARFFTT